MSENALRYLKHPKRPLLFVVLAQSRPLLAILFQSFAVLEVGLVAAVPARVRIPARFGPRSGKKAVDDQ